MTDAIRLIGDIGGTNARFALAQGGRYEALGTLKVAEFPSLEAAIAAYLLDVPGDRHPSEGALAVAGPVTGDVFAMTNHQWQFSRSELATHFGMRQLLLVNDFTATALALPWLGERDLRRIGGGEPRPAAPLALLGPGTGLGVSGLIPTEHGFVPLQGEGGHVTLAAVTPREVAVLEVMRARFDHLSAERALSGPGLVNLYQAVCALEGVGPVHDDPSAIQHGADTDPACAEAVALFCALLGNVAGNLVLTLGAWGGLYIAGGIVPRLVETLVRSDFRERFLSKGRLRTLLEQVPTWVITHPNPALLGLARVP
jgi:glucokinase